MSQEEINQLIYEEQLTRDFLTYAVSVLTDRALPDVRDGLLPVQRRILLSMHDQRLTSTGQFAKSAKIIGSTMGSYHPHGDSSIYGALVRMAQNFSLRLPLVDGHGAFGSIDGDGAASMRYTEARLTPSGELLLEGLHPDVVPFGRNFDESRPEAEVLPAALPNLLINGNMGIAVGMSSRFAPHNPGEVLDLLIWRLKNPKASPKTLVKRLPGPDFPGGGVIVAGDELTEAYLSGEGKITVMGVAHIEPSSGGRAKVVVTEMPLPKKGTFLEKVAKLHQDGKLPELVDLNDFSREDIRVEMELKRGANAQAFLARLYKLTELSETYPIQMNALVDGRPTTVSLTDCVDLFLAFRREVLLNLAKKRVGEIEERLHKLDAYLKALSAIDAVVKAIKTAKDQEQAKTRLKKLLKIDDQQVGWVLELPLRRLTKLDKFKIEQEIKELGDELSSLRKLIKTPALMTEKMVEGFRALKKEVAIPRRSRLSEGGQEAELPEADLTAPVASEPCTLMVSSSGRAGLISGKPGRAALRLDEGERLICLQETKTDADKLVFTSTGRCLLVRLADLPLESKRGRGTIIAGLEAGEELCAVHSPEEKGSLLFVYASGQVKRSAKAEFSSAHAGGIQAAKPADGDRVIAVLDCPDKAQVILASSAGKAIRFEASSLREMGRAAYGVRGIKLSGGEEVIGCAVSPDELLVTSRTGDKTLGKRIDASEVAVKGRGGAGVVIFKASSRSGELAQAIPVSASLWVQSPDGALSALDGSSVPVAARAAAVKPIDVDGLILAF